jgi:hypothetical protein
MSDPGTGISNVYFLSFMKFNSEGANGTVRLIKLVILMLDSAKELLTLMCLHVNVTVITFVTVNYFVLLNTFDTNINYNTAVMIQYHISTHTNNDNI